MDYRGKRETKTDLMSLVSLCFEYSHRFCVFRSVFRKKNMIQANTFAFLVASIQALVKQLELKIYIGHLDDRNFDDDY